MKKLLLLSLLLVPAVAQDKYPSIPPTTKPLAMVLHSVPVEKIKAALGIIYEDNPKALVAQYKMIDSAKGHITLTISTWSGRDSDK